MEIVRIRMKDYERLAGVLGGVRIRAGEQGSSWMLPDGNLVAERYDGQEWSWYLVRC